MELVNPYGNFAAIGNTFHVATSGNDAAEGNEAAPWATLAYATSRLKTGDTLIVGGGTYHEQNITITENGTEARPITIIKKTGETPIIDGSLAAYRTSGNTAWEVFDAGRHIYRTVATLDVPDNGYTGRIDVSGTLYALTAYRDNGVATGLTFLSADVDLFDTANPYYMGPGVAYSSGRVYIRLDPNSAQAQWDGTTYAQAPFVISDLDPRNHAIYLAPNNNAFTVDGDWVTIDGIDMRYHWNTITGAGTDLTVKNLTMFPTRFGALVGADRWTFDNVTIEFHRPSWLARSDVKSDPTPAEYSRTGAVAWQGTVDGQFINGTINGAFDGFLALNDETGLRILNNSLLDTMDDACQTGAGVHDFEFAYNLVTGAGISHDSSGTADTPDTVYIHHNVFDNLTRLFWSRNFVVGGFAAEGGDDGYEHVAVFPAHGVPATRDPWKIYNNTLQTASSPGQQGINHYLPDMGSTATGQGVHEAYNNIINYNDNNYVYRYANAQIGFAIYDYNIYARTIVPTEYPWALDSVSTAGATVASTATFAAWLTDMGSATGYYPAGWDSHSISQTTMVALDGSYRPSLGGPADGTGVNLSAKGWPGTTPGTTYIGAKAPA